MARTIKSLRKKSKPRKKYDWPRWTNGSPWQVIRGQDFFTTANVFRNYLNCVASRIGLKVTTRVAGDAVEFQFSAREASV